MPNAQEDPKCLTYVEYIPVPCFSHARFRQIAQHMAKQPADFHSLAMNPHTARWYVSSQLSSIRPAKNIISLQVSTSIQRPFHPRRPYQVQDHLNRSRYPVTMPQQQPNQALPMRAASLKLWQDPLPVQTPYQPNCLSTMTSQLDYNYFNQISSDIMITPKSADVGLSYIAANQTPETQEPWDTGKDSRHSENAGD